MIVVDGPATPELHEQAGSVELRPLPAVPPAAPGPPAPTWSRVVALRRTP
jgi:hypothetical protein